MPGGYRALIVCQLMEQRLRLQHILEHSSEFQEVVSVHNFKEALLLCSTTDPWDVAFVSDHFEDMDCGSFVEQMRAGIGGADCALIRLCSHQKVDKDAVANNMILGFHGFVCTPYSFDDLIEAVALAKGVKLQGSNLRLKAATGLMLTDTFAEDSNEASAEGDLWQKVRKSWDDYKTNTGQSLTLAVVDTLQQLSPAKRLTGYNGVSERVRRLFKKNEDET